MRSLSFVVVPPIERFTPVRAKESAGQESSIAGAIEKTPLPPAWSLESPAPIVPVSPTAVTLKLPPIAGDDVETEIDSILFAAAEMTSITFENPSLAAQSCVEPACPGLPFQTSTVHDCAAVVALPALRNE